jgi:homoserine kinase type II
VEGNEYDFARGAQAVEAGRTLARFHLASEPFEHDGPGPQYKAPLLDCWVDPMRDVDALADLLEGRAQDKVMALREWWRTTVREWPHDRISGLPSGWVRGDFHGRNIVYRGDRIAGVFDFDDVDRGPYAFDLAVGMFRFGRAGRGMLVMRPPFVRAFLDGYESLRPITSEERAALPVLLAMRYPPHPQHYAYWRDERGEDIEERFATEVDAIRSRHAQVLRFGERLFEGDP